MAKVVEGDITAAAAIKSDFESDFMLGDCCTEDKFRDERGERGEGGEGGKRRYQGYVSNRCPPPNNNRAPPAPTTTTTMTTKTPDSEHCWQSWHHWQG